MLMDERARWDAEVLAGCGKSPPAAFSHRAEVVYVLHAFQKKTQKTRQEDIELARARYRQIGGRI